jgi:hypothetical protein
MKDDPRLRRLEPLKRRGLLRFSDNSSSTTALPSNLVALIQKNFFYVCIKPLNLFFKEGFVMSSYTIQELITLKPSRDVLCQPTEDLLVIIISSASNTNTSQKNRKPNGGKSNTNWGKRGPHRLKESSNSFSAASRRKTNQDESTKVICEVRVMLNKVTDDNMEIIIEQTRSVCCPKIQSIIDEMDEDEDQDLMTQLAKLFVQKAKIDHAFSKWYAQIASEFKITDFGDVLYEVCREILPLIRYDPDKKQGYLGALLLLVELRRNNMITKQNLEAAADRLFNAINRNLGNTVMATNTETPIDPIIQIEVCVELLCKFLPPFFKLDKPSSADNYIKQLHKISSNKEKVKPRSRFLLMDFFKTSNSQEE